jgi:hypothetical protein
MIFGNYHIIAKSVARLLPTAASLLPEGFRTADWSCLIAKHKNAASVIPIPLQSFHL